MIKHLEFRPLTSDIYEAKGVACHYKIESRNGKYYAIKEICVCGAEKPIPFVTFKKAEQWCQDDFEEAVGKFLRKP